MHGCRLFARAPSDRAPVARAQAIEQMDRAYLASMPVATGERPREGRTKRSFRSTREGPAGENSRRPRRRERRSRTNHRSPTVHSDHLLFVRDRRTGWRQASLRGNFERNVERFSVSLDPPNCAVQPLGKSSVRRVVGNICWTSRWQAAGFFCRSVVRDRRVRLRVQCVL